MTVALARADEIIVGTAFILDMLMSRRHILTPTCTGGADCAQKLQVGR